MRNYFETKVKYIKIDDNGKEKKVSELYMTDTESFTEAEARITKEMETLVQGSFIVTGLKRSNITEIVNSDDPNDDRWYKAKVFIIDCDELTGKEKKSSQFFLVQAKDFITAYDNLQGSLAEYIVPYEIHTIQDTNFMDVFPYFE